MKVLRNLFTFIVGFSFIVAVGLYCARAQAPTIVYVQDPNIPSTREIQQRLKEMGIERYDPGKIDGVIGKNSRKAWDNYICDQHAKRTFKYE